MPMPSTSYPLPLFSRSSKDECKASHPDECDAFLSQLPLPLALSDLLLSTTSTSGSIRVFMAFRSLFHAVKRHFRTICLIVYLLVGFPPFIAWFWNSDPIPDFIAGHAEISFIPVSRWYGPGIWLALILSVISGAVILLHTAYTNPRHQKWNPDIITVSLYCLASCWDLRKIQQTVQGAEGRLGVSFLPALTAASRAVVFSGGVLEVYAVLLLPQLFDIKTDIPPRRATIFQFVLAWATSVVAISVIPPDIYGQDSTFKTYFPCLDTDPTCQDGRQLIRSYVFFSQILSTIPGSLFRTLGSFYISFDPVIYLFPWGIYGIIAGIVIMILTLPDWIRGLRWGISIGALTALVLPMFVWAFTVASLFTFIHPVACTIQFGTILALAAIPRSGVFPYSGISMREVDQIGVLLVVVVYYLIQGRASGVSKSWKIIRKSQPRRDEEEGTLMSESSHYVSKVNEQ